MSARARLSLRALEGHGGGGWLLSAGTASGRAVWGVVPGGGLTAAKVPAGVGAISAGVAAAGRSSVVASSCVTARVAKARIASGPSEPDSETLRRVSSGPTLALTRATPLSHAINTLTSDASGVSKLASNRVS